MSRTSLLRGIFVTATDTGVGKTHVGTRLVEAMTRQGLRVAVRKPVESGCELQDGELLPADALRLRAAAGAREPLQTICPLRFRHALSPPRAASLTGTRIFLAQLRDAVLTGVNGETESNWLHVEGAGGICSPIAEDGLNADLAAALRLPVVLVVPDRLGGINQALMGLAAAAAWQLRVAAVVLNRLTTDADPDLDNAGELAAHTGHAVFSLGHGPGAGIDALLAHLLQSPDSGE